MSGHPSSGPAVGPATPDPALVAAIREAACEGRLPCAAALALARRLRCSPLHVGRTCDLLGVKIVACQLGCFGRGDRRPGPEEERGS
ncbi:MAG: hypothetical protein K6U08_07870 [Firmicutes bacterium]|nr:hypothetical protein [Bacillota bacterium]